ncbi:Staphylococcal nuclease domain-containing protein 1 [Geodia barretti]|uniref:Staphylococcal nuclease domain-containing protein 1 n=1 Tax=Geodia barretti TaxID=519541 RepID=A0AA35QT34_GEOBA|nr:Staphylococcal nuclease domain-containing protein 1 [Geodia barretti]
MSQTGGASVSSHATRGIVKQVLSGDTVVIRGQPCGGPPPTRTIALSNILAPRLARRGNPNVEGSLDTVDEQICCRRLLRGSGCKLCLIPFSWEAREFLRKLLVGKEVKFVVEHKATNREYGTIWVAANGCNVADQLLNEGLVEVRQAGARPSD